MLPQDPMILLSVVNTRLRDEFDSLDAFCDHNDVSKEEIVKLLGSIGYRYDESQNAFK